MNGAHRLQRCFADPIAPSIRIDVIPIFGRVVGWLGETIIERLIKRLDRGSGRQLPGRRSGQQAA